MAALTQLRADEEPIRVYSHQEGRHRFTVGQYYDRIRTSGMLFFFSRIFLCDHAPSVRSERHRVAPLKAPFELTK